MKLSNSHSISRIFNVQPEILFSLVTDFNNYKSWNTLIPAAQGDLKLGSKIKMILKINGKKRPFDPQVVSINLNQSFTLSKVILLKQIGELNHKFEFCPLQDGSTELRQTWTGKGMLINLLWPLIKRSFAEFEVFNDNLYKHLQNLKTI